MEDRNKLLREGLMEEADGKVNERFKEKEDEKQKLGEEEEEEEPDWMKNFADAKESKEAMNTFEKRMKKSCP